MSYTWTAADWQRSFKERIANLWLLNLINLAVVVGTLLMHPQVQNGADARFFLPAIMWAVDFALCYTFLSDINQGYFAGIACGGMFGAPMIALFPCADNHVSIVVPFLLGPAVAFICFWYAASYYKGMLTLLNKGGVRAIKRRRGEAF